MADESVEHRDTSSGSTGRAPRDEEINKAGSRRRVLITNLLAAPAVMTLGARSARAQNSCATSFANNHATSHHCKIPPPNG
jgi:hypothetical protein